jgi:peptidoglycan/xylan/chitin deacetylase (PgdA/CDA1 family)
MLWNRWDHRNKQFIGDFCYNATYLKSVGGYHKMPLAWGSDDITAVMAAKDKGIANTQAFCFQYRENAMTISSSGNARVKMDAAVAQRKWYDAFLASLSKESLSESDRQYLDTIDAARDLYYYRALGQNCVDVMKGNPFLIPYCKKKLAIFNLSNYTYFRFYITSVKNRIGAWVLGDRCWRFVDVRNTIHHHPSPITHHKMLFITCHKLDDNNGGANASKGFVNCIASLFDDCALIYPEFDNPNAYISSVYKLYPCHDARPKLQKGLDMYRGVVSGLHAHVVKHLKTHRYDVIVIDHSVTATSLMKCLKKTGARIITIHHNVERDYLRDNGNERPVTFRYPYNYFAKKSERECLLNSDVNITLTQSDAREFESWYPSRNLHLHSVGIMEYRQIADKTFEPRAKGSTFVISGSLCFIQSLVPIVDFVKRYHKCLKHVCPEARLVITGRNPSPMLYEACKGREDIEIIPDPEDMEAVVRHADYYICPISAGSGMKLRVMDGLKQGLPVLCHEVSTAGYEKFMEDGMLHAYKDETTFMASLRKMLSMDIPQHDIYESFRQYFSPEAGRERMRKAIVGEAIIYNYKSC